MYQELKIHEFVTQNQNQSSHTKTKLSHLQVRTPKMKIIHKIKILNSKLYPKN